MSLSGFEYYLSKKDLADSTKRHYLSSAKSFCESADNVSDEALEDYLYNILKTSTPANHNRHLKGLKHYCQYIDYQFPKDKLKRIRERPQPRVPITDDEIDAIINVVPPPDKYAVLLKTLSYTGARPVEILNLMVQDIDQSAHAIMLGKHKTEARTIPILEALRPDLYSYVSSLETEYLFCSSNKPLTHAAMMKNWKMRLTKLGIKKPVKPYAMRRSFITNTLGSGASLYSIQDMVGHKSAETTRMYYHGNIDLMKEAANTLPRAMKAVNPWAVVQQILELVRKYLGYRDDVSVEITEKSDEVVIRIKKKNDKIPKTRL